MRLQIKTNWMSKCDTQNIGKTFFSCCARNPTWQFILYCTSKILCILNLKLIAVCRGCMHTFELYTFLCACYRRIMHKVNEWKNINAQIYNENEFSWFPWYIINAYMLKHHKLFFKLEFKGKIIQEMEDGVPKSLEYLRVFGNGATFQVKL